MAQGCSVLSTVRVGSIVPEVGGVCFITIKLYLHSNNRMVKEWQFLVLELSTHKNNPWVTVVPCVGR